MNNLVALGIKPVDVPDPVSQYAKVAGARNLIQQGQVRQQQAEAGALKLQEERRGLAEQETVRQALTTAGGDLAKARQALGATPGISRDTLTKFDDELDKHTKALAAQKDEQFKQFTNSTAAANDALTAVAQLPPDSPQQQAVYDQRQQALIQAGLLDPAKARPYTGHEDVLQQLSIATTAKQLADRATEKRAQATADAAAAEASHKQRMFPDQEAEAGTKALTAAEDLALKRKQNAGTNELGVGEKDRQALANTAARDANTAENERVIRQQGERRLGLEAQRSDIARKIYEQTYGEGANPALVGVEPKLRTKAAGAAEKAAADYVKGQAATADMQSLIDLARSGNKLAYRMVPLEGVLEITTPRGTVRINKQELDAYGGAGSFFDKIQGSIGKALTGASIPPSVLKDIEETHRHLADGIQQTYDQKLNGINQTYRSDFKPVSGRKGSGGGSGPAVGTVEGGYRFKGGNPADKANWEKQ